MKTTQIIEELKNCGIEHTVIECRERDLTIEIPNIGEILIRTFEITRVDDIISRLEGEALEIETTNIINKLEGITLTESIEEAHQIVHSGSYIKYLLNTYPWLIHIINLTYNLRLDILERVIMQLQADREEAAMFLTTINTSKGELK